MLRTTTGDRFDSVLDLTSVESGYHANLYLDLKVCLQKLEPPSGQSHITYVQADDQVSSNIDIVRWPSTSVWHDWCRRFEHDAEEFFDSKLWLVPSNAWIGHAPVPGSGGRTEYRAGIRCGFRMRRVEMSEAHLVCDAAYLDSQSQPFRSYAHQTDALRELRLSASSGNPENLATVYRACFAGTGRLNLTHVDLDPVQRVAFGTTLSQRTYLHELGHALGLGHVTGGDNSGSAYGTTAHSAGDLMGMGERIEPWHAFPWRRALQRHLRSAEAPTSWRATTQRPQVQTDRIYTRTTSTPMESGGVPQEPLDGGVAMRGPTRRGGPEGVEA